MEVGLAIYSRTTSFASLSVRSPRKTEQIVQRPLRKLDPGDQYRVHPLTRFMTAGVIPNPQRPRVFSGKLIKIKGHVDRLSSGVAHRRLPTLSLKTRSRLGRQTGVPLDCCIPPARSRNIYGSHRVTCSRRSRILETW
jgi:hypothetical protein